MTFAERCFSLLAKARQDNGGVLPRDRWIKIVDGIFEMERAIIPKKKRGKGSLMTDEEWLVSLEQEPVLAGIAIREQLALAQFWCKNHSRQCTRRFFVDTWLPKAERKIVLPGGKQVTISSDVYKEPESWRTSQFARKALQLSSESWEIVVSRDWLDLDTNMRATILRAL